MHEHLLAIYAALGLDVINLASAFLADNSPRKWLGRAFQRTRAS